MTAMPESVTRALEGYEAGGGWHDEAVGPDGEPRPECVPILEAVTRQDPAQLRARLAGAIDRRGVAFHSVDGDAAFAVDPVPRIIEAAEWQELEAGLAQRVRALDAFVADVYGDQAIIAADIVPRAAVEGCDYYEPSLRGHRPPGGVWTNISGLDLVRDEHGELRVLEDNLRTPSGMAYAIAAREALAPLLGDVEPAPRPLDGLAAMLGDVLRAAAPPDARESDGLQAVLLTDGRDNSAFFEHQWLAAHLHIALAEADELEVRGGWLHLHRRGERDSRLVDVVYRRTNEDRAADPVGELLLEPWKKGTVGLVNAFGTGVADDKLLHAYVEQMVAFYLGEEPLLRSVPTYDLSRPEVLAEQRPRLRELVVKPRTGHGGVGIVIGPHASPEDLARVAADVDARPDAFVAQELVTLSRHPTAIGDRLAPRHVDLRPFVFHAGEHVQVLPGGLTRVAFTEGSLVVNSSQNGGAKDTWVLPA